jgi:uncharacterized protein (DUF934 family)
MPLVRDCRVVEDRFVHLADDEPIPDRLPVIVSAQRFLADHDGFAGRLAPVGVVWPNDRPVGELAPYLASVALVALVFPKFRDGRAYSQARLLRERHGFRGELRATGQVLRDQFLFLLRAGFDSFDVSKPADAAAFAESVRRYGVFYQPTADGRLTALRARRHRAQSFEPRRPPQAAFRLDDMDVLTRS